MVALAGVPCPRCRSTALRVYATRRLVGGVIVRYRECTVCLTSVKTEERATPFRGRKIATNSNPSPMHVSATSRQR